MKLVCDLCGGELETRADGISAVCRNCGIEYGTERLHEKRDELLHPSTEIPDVRYITTVCKIPPEKETPPIREIPPKKETPPIREIPPEKETPVVKEVPCNEKSQAATKKESKKMKIMRIILACIFLLAFIGVFVTDGIQLGILYFVCVAATILTLVIFKPWNVYGGKAI